MSAAAIALALLLAQGLEQDDGAHAGLDESTYSSLVPS